MKNPPAMQETLVRFLSWDEPLEKGTATHSSTVGKRIPWTSLWGCKESDTTEHFSFSCMGGCKGIRTISGASYQLFCDSETAAI